MQELLRDCVASRRQCLGFEHQQEFRKSHGLFRRETDTLYLDDSAPRLDKNHILHTLENEVDPLRLICTDCDCLGCRAQFLVPSLDSVCPGR
jgi:hypothetical protein